MKEAVIYKILRYRQNRCHTNEERWIDHSWHKAKIFSEHERFWNNLHQVAQNQKIGKTNNLIVLGAQDLWVLMLCRSFFYTYRSQLTQSKNPTSPTVSVRIHRRITRQHPRLHQHPHHKNDTPNISTRFIWQ
jgi:hypothetical protein